jgi:Na+/H+ antiporter NhaC
MNTWLSILPPVLAIVLAIRTRQVFVSLFLGLVSGSLILLSGHPIKALVDTMDRLVAVFSDRSNVQVIFFCSLVGSLIALIERSGGLEGFIRFIVNRDLIRTRRGAQLLGYLVGILIFVESNIKALVTGAVARPLCDKLRVSREKLSLITDTTDAPVCMMIPLNGWGALIIALLSGQAVSDPVRVLAYSVPLSFYLFVVLAVLLIVLLTGRDFGPMRAAERRAQEEGKLLRDGATPLMAEDVAAIEPKPGITPRAINMVAPMLVMIVMIFVGLYITGNGEILKGSGSTSVLWAVGTAVLVSLLMCFAQRIFTLDEAADLVMKGITGLLPVNIILVLAFALGAVCGDLGTGKYVAQIFSAALPAWLLPAVIFGVSCLISFSTGSSWGTFAIMVPVAVPAAAALDVSLPLAVGAVLSGGVFGDHASILSDTTIVSAMASVADLVDHFTTQLPYALVAAGVSLVLYLVAGLVMM